MSQSSQIVHPLFAIFREPPGHGKACVDSVVRKSRIDGQLLEPGNGGAGVEERPGEIVSIRGDVISAGVIDASQAGSSNAAATSRSYQARRKMR